MCKQPPQIDKAIFVDLDRPERASLFDYFSSIELIPLETSSDVLIAGITKIINHQDKWYMLDKPQSIIFVFDQTGKFLFKIDKKGQGVGEYLFISDFNINPFTGNLEVLESFGNLNVYDLSGNHIETKLIKYDGFYAVHQFAALDSCTYIFYSISQPKKIIYFNLDEKKLLHEEFKESERLGSFASHNLYQGQDDWYIFRPIHPVVYKIGKERLEVAFQFDFGTHTREGTTAIFSSEAERFISKAVEELYAQFPYLIEAVRHNSKYVFASLSLKNDQQANIIYDKSTGKSKFILDFSEQVKFNSYRGEEIIVTDEYVLMPVQWVDLENRITKEMLDDKNKEIFEKLLGAKMELNPVLIKYRFK
ncbi:hypothetical protein FACS189432_08760 [Bacteroidia bacterium]|nr:hypothetical protein FACS189426_10870 [Bacteroidia bacterium]GHT29593.1 hypothetical protein FACS189432_08760 [Bacteroidia bacterium]GHT86264.1 hypothetical protein FACS18947_5980 [Bacteroidia bacterium]